MNTPLLCAADATPHSQLHTHMFTLNIFYLSKKYAPSQTKISPKEKDMAAWPCPLRRSPPSSVYVAFLLNAEQLAQDPAEQFGALYNDDLHTHTPPFSVNFGLWNNQQPRAPPRLQQASAGAGISWQPANRRRRPHKTNLYCICVSPKSSPIRFRNHGVSRVYYQHIRHAEKGADFSAVKTSIF